MNAPPDFEFYDFDDFPEEERHLFDCTCELCLQNHPEREIYLDDETWLQHYAETRRRPKRNTLNLGVWVFYRTDSGRWIHGPGPWCPLWLANWWRGNLPWHNARTGYRGKLKDAPDAPPDWREN